LTFRPGNGWLAVNLALPLAWPALLPIWGVKMNKPMRKKVFSAERAMLKRQGVIMPEGSRPAAFSAPGAAADNGEILEAIESLRTEMRSALKSLKAQPPDNIPELNTLRGQLKILSDHIEDTKKEIAAVSHPGAGEDKLTTAAQELGAIVASTEEATHKILNATEDIEERVQMVKERISDAKSIDHLNEISKLGIAILEACNFQDINGQRTNKVVKTINFLEEKIERMVDIWGADQFEGIEIVDDRDADAKLLEGPQLEGQGVSQADIDALFD